ncbi:MAG: peptidoglycan-associated lipoprotein Pal [Pseudomonadota bacterium]
MRVFTLKALTAAVLVVAVAGCTKTKTDDSASTAATVPSNTAAVAPAASTDTTTSQGGNFAGQDNFAGAGGTASGNGGASASGFENNPGNYTGDTRTRVIYFGFDRAEVPSAAYATLKAHARALAGNPNARLKLEGHADERGTPEYNVALAERRANAVQKFLELNGAKAGQIEVVSFGEEKPADLGHDELAWAKNRRAELVYTAGNP